ncbi:hypothetical protein M9Y10_000797 [Tritrichomonas musculus]|uniref:Uncharacterized protein n=1 Tax=Tritrichomonas musculus TaxID=1915356 RepID=A0ABR2L663_9EUKA
MDHKKCTICDDGYGLVVETGLCAKCNDENCDSCLFDFKECMKCKDNYHFDTAVNSPHYNKCVPFNVPCSVRECQRCIYNLKNKCAQCNYGYQLGRDGECQKQLHEIEMPKIDAIYTTINNSDIINGTCELNVSKYDIQSEKLLVFQINDTNILSEIIIDNSKNQSFAIEVGQGVSQLTIKPKNNGSFTLIQSNKGAPLTINLNNRSFASILDAKGELTIKCIDCSSSLNLNQIKISSEKLELVPKTSLNIDTLNFNGAQKLIVQSNDSEKVRIKTVKVEQKTAAKIVNSSIFGKIIFGLSSSLEINEFVDLSNSLIDLPFNPSQIQGLYDKAPINGILNTKPRLIIISDRGVNRLLSNNKYLIAESTEEFDCEKWKVIINNEADKSNMNQYFCTKNETGIYGNVVYRLYGIEGDQKKDKKLVIITIVVVCCIIIVIALIVFIVVYFLVIKKRKATKIEDDTQQELQDPEVPNFY